MAINPEQPIGLFGDDLQRLLAEAGIDNLDFAALDALMGDPALLQTSDQDISGLFDIGPTQFSDDLVLVDQPRTASALLALQNRRAQLQNWQARLQEQRAAYEAQLFELTQGVNTPEQALFGSEQFESDHLGQMLNKDQEQRGEGNEDSPGNQVGIQPELPLVEIDFVQADNQAEIEALIEGFVILGTLRAQIARIPPQVRWVSFAGVISSATAFADAYEQELFAIARRQGQGDGGAAIEALLRMILEIAKWVALITALITIIDEQLRRLWNQPESFPLGEEQEDTLEQVLPAGSSDYQEQVDPSESPDNLESVPLDGDQGPTILTAEVEGDVTTTSDGRDAIKFNDGTQVEDKGTPISQADALDAAWKWVGGEQSYEYPEGSDNHYSQTQPDGTVHRFRATEGDLGDTQIGPHINFESGRWVTDKHGRTIFDSKKNLHVRIKS